MSVGNTPQSIAISPKPALFSGFKIPIFRQERETGYKQHEAQHMGSRGDLQAKIDISTQSKLKEIDVNMEGK